MPGIAATNTKSYRVTGFSDGIQRHLPRHLIKDTALWDAKNVRFDIGRIKPILTDKAKKTGIAGTATDGIISLPYHVKGSTAYHALIGNDTAPAKGVFRQGDTYADGVVEGDATPITTGDWTAGGTAGSKPAQYDVYGKSLYFATNNSNTTKGIILFDSSAGTFTDNGNSSIGAGHLKMFENILKFVSYTGETATYWTNLLDYNNWSTGQSGNFAYETYLAEMESISNYLIIYIAGKTYRLRYVGYPTIWVKEEVSPSVSCKGYSTGLGTMNMPVVSMNNLHYLISDDKNQTVFMFDGNNFTDIGLPIRSLIYSTLQGWSSSNVVLSTYNAVDDEVWFYLADSWSGAQSEVFYIFNTKTKSWSYASVTGTASMQLPATHVRMEVMSNRYYPNIPRYAYKKLNGATYTHEIYEIANGSTMRVPNIDTKLYDFSTPEIYKRVTKVQIILSKTAAVTMDVRLDYTNDPSTVTAGTSYAVSFNTNTVEFYPDQSAKYFSLNISTATTAYTTAWEIAEIIFYFVPRGLK